MSPVDTPVARMLRGSENLRDEEMVVERPDGSRRTVLANIDPVRDAAGAVVGAITALVDITSRKAAEQQLRAIADFTYDWKSWVGPDGVPLWINPAVARIAGVSVADCMRMSEYPLPLIHDDDRERMRAHLRGALGGTTGNDIAFRIKRPDGGLVWVAISWQPMSGAEGIAFGYRSSIRDISERKSAEEDLVQRNRQLELLERTSYRLLVDDGPEDEMLTTIFASIANLLGVESWYHYRPIEARLLGLQIAEGIGDAERRLFGTMKFGDLLCGRVAETRERLIIEDLQNCIHLGANVLREAGATSYAGFPLVAHGNLIGTVAFVSRQRTHFRDGELTVVRSICDQVAAMLERRCLQREVNEVREDLERQLSQLEAIYTEAPLGLALLDHDLRFLRINSALAQMNGYSVAEHIGKNAWDLLPELRASAEPALRRGIDTGEALRDVVVKGQTAGQPGVMREWREHFFPLRWSNGKFEAIAVICEEVTQRSAAERARLASDARLRRAAKAAMFGVHELDPRRQIVTWSSEMDRILGTSGEDRTASLDRTLATIHPEDRERVRTQMEAIQRQMGPYELACRIVRPDGEVRYILDRGESVGPVDPETGVCAGVTGIVIDITERAEADRLRSYVIKLSDALRPLSKAIKIQAEAGRVLGEELKANRTAYYAIEDDWYVIGADYTIASPSMAGRHPTALFGRDLLEQHRRGKPVVVHDVGTAHSEAEAEQLRAIHIGAYVGVPLVKNGELVAGLTVQSSSPRRWTAVEVDIVAETAERTWAAVERAQLEDRLHHSEALLRAVLASTPDLVWAKNRRGQITLGNDATFALLGNGKADGVLGRGAKDLVPEAEQARTIEHNDARVLAGGQPLLVEERITVRREERVFQTVKAPLRDAGGAIVGIVGVSRDVTEQKRREEHTQLLMHEVNHRAKNMLALVQVIARQSVKSGRDDFLASFTDRLRALAAKQDLLVQHHWKGAELGALIENQLMHLRELVGDRIILTGPKVNVSAKAAETLGMVIHELATNAAKYGALSNNEGRIEISWWIGEEDNRTFSITWKEERGPCVVAPAHRGFGHHLIDSITAAALSGKVTLDYARTGFAWRLSCPWAAISTSEGTAAKAVSVGPSPRRPNPANGILIVEDDAVLALDLAGALQQAGFATVGPAASTVEALDLLQQGSICCAILDFRLGEETSEPVAHRLRDAVIPFIMISSELGSQMPAVFNEAPCFSKPLHLPELLQELRKLLAGAAGKSTPPQV